MTDDFDFETDNYQPDNEIFYRGYVSPADEWSFKPESLFPALNGSIFEARDAAGRRLARLNKVIAFAESRNIKQYNKKARLTDQYNFLNQFIPENLFTKITEVLGFTSRDKKNIAKDIGLNLDTLANIVSLWQLELHSQATYIADQTLEELNAFLRESSSNGEMHKRGHLTTKDIERAENRILKQLYVQNAAVTDQEGPKTSIPVRVLNYYQEFMQTGMHEHLMNRHKKLLEKQPNGTLPFHVYLLLQKIAILKKILPKIALDYFKLYISKEDMEQLSEILNLYYQDKKAMIGELIVQGIVLLEAFYDKEAMIKEDTPVKFQQRLRKYRLDEKIKPAFIELVTIVRQNQPKEQVTPAKTSESDKTIVESEIVTEIKQQITALTEVPTEKIALTDLLIIDSAQVNDIEKSQLHKRKILQSYRFIAKTMDIPEEVFEEIIETIMLYNIPLQSKKGLVKGLSLNTIMTIIALWNMLLQANNNILIDSDLEKLNNYLEKNGYINSKAKKIVLKKLELTENRILLKMYEKQVQRQKITTYAKYELDYA